MAGLPQLHVPITLGLYCLDMLILARKENLNTQRETLREQERSTAGTQLI